MPETIQLKQAMPTEDDRSIVLDVLHWIETYIETGYQFDAEGNEHELTDEQFVDRLRLHFESAGRNFGNCWQRVLYAGLCAIDNACDPSETVLTWKPEIARALALTSAETSLAQSYRTPSRRDRLCGAAYSPERNE